MKSNEKRYSTCIARQVGKNGARLSVDDQAVNEKSTTSGRNSQPNDEEDSLIEETQRGSPTEGLSINNKTTRQKWTRDEYKSVMKAYYQAIERPTETSNTKETYRIWRNENPEIRPNMDENKLANVRRDIVNKKRLSEAELEELRQGVKENQPDEREKQENPIVEENENVQNEAQPSEVPEDHAEQKVDAEGLGNDDIEEIEDFQNDILRRWIEISDENMYRRDKPPKIRINKKTKKVELANKAITNIKKEHQLQDLTDVNSLMYASAYVITMRSDHRPIKKNTNKARRNQEPKWKVKIKREIEKLRREISLLTEVLNPNSHISERKKVKICKRNKIKSISEITEVKERITQQLLAKSQRLRRMSKRQQQFRQNNKFKESPKLLYRELGKKQIEVEKNHRKKK